MNTANARIDIDRQLIRCFLDDNKYREDIKSILYMQEGTDYAVITGVSTFE